MDENGYGRRRADAIGRGGTGEAASMISPALSPSENELLASELADVPVDDVGRLTTPWHGYPKGTDRGEIRLDIDESHPMGYVALLRGLNREGGGAAVGIDEAPVSAGEVIHRDAAWVIDDPAGSVHVAAVAVTEDPSPADWHAPSGEWGLRVRIARLNPVTLLPEALAAPPRECSDGRYMDPADWAPAVIRRTGCGAMSAFAAIPYEMAARAAEGDTRAALAALDEVSKRPRFEHVREIAMERSGAHVIDRAEALEVVEESWRRAAPYDHACPWQGDYLFEDGEWWPVINDAAGECYVESYRTIAAALADLDERMGLDDVRALDDLLSTLGYGMHAMPEPEVARAAVRAVETGMYGVPAPQGNALLVEADGRLHAAGLPIDPNDPDLPIIAGCGSMRVVSARGPELERRGVPDAIDGAGLLELSAHAAHAVAHGAAPLLGRAPRPQSATPPATEAIKAALQTRPAAASGRDETRGWKP